MRFATLQTAEDTIPGITIASSGTYATIGMSSDATTITPGTTPTIFDTIPTTSASIPASYVPFGTSHGRIRFFLIARGENCSIP
jgi:hypothetical protein